MFCTVPAGANRRRQQRLPAFQCRTNAFLQDWPDGGDAVLDLQLPARDRLQERSRRGRRLARCDQGRRLGEAAKCAGSCSSCVAGGRRRGRGRGRSAEAGSTRGRCHPQAKRARGATLWLEPKWLRSQSSSVFLCLFLSLSVSVCLRLCAGGLGGRRCAAPPPSQKPGRGPGGTRAQGPGAFMTSTSGTGAFMTTARGSGAFDGPAASTCQPLPRSGRRARHQWHCRPGHGPAGRPAGEKPHESSVTPLASRPPGKRRPASEGA